MNALALEPTSMSTADVAAFANATYRQIDYWCRLGILVAHDARTTPGSGHSRGFTFDEARVAAAVARLSALGATAPVLKNVAAMLRAFDEAEWRGALLVSASGAVAPLGSVETGVTFGSACWMLNLNLINHA